MSKIAREAREEAREATARIVEGRYDRLYLILRDEMEKSKRVIPDWFRRRFLKTCPGIDEKYMVFAWKDFVNRREELVRKM